MKTAFLILPFGFTLNHAKVTPTRLGSPTMTDLPVFGTSIGGNQHKHHLSPPDTGNGIRGNRRVQEHAAFPNAVWTSQGYGYTIDARSLVDAPQYYEETAVSCVINPFIEFAINNVEIDEAGTNAVVEADGSISNYLFDRSSDFRSGCANGPNPIEGVDPDYQRDPLYLFDILTQTFLEHYAFFDLRDIDWSTTTAQARMDLMMNSTDEELIEAIISVLAPLDDGHVTFDAEEHDVSFQSAPAAVLVQLYQEFLAQDEIEDMDSYVSTQIVTWLTILSGYLDDENALFQSTKLDELSWGTTANGTIGYLNVFTMGPEDQERYSNDVRQAMSDLHDTHVMIIDIRVNGGGFDLVGLGIASYFTEHSYVAFTKKAVNGNDFTPQTEIFVEPARDQELRYSGQVILIVSESTASAAEIFTMAMSELPQVTLMGRNTSGELSDMLPKTLPNSWTFTLSNEVYLTPKGDSYEMTGIPPDIRPETDVLLLSERQAGVDSWMELALEVAQDRIDEMVVKSPSPTEAPTDDSTGSDPTDPPTAVPTDATSSGGLSSKRGWSSLSIFFMTAGGWMAVALVGL
jgi:carboxyl-terminal processing protease